MKNRTSLFALSFSAGLLALSLNGCSSISSDSSSPNAARPVGGKAINILQLRDDVKTTRLALNRTTDALNRVPGAPDKLAAYNAFSTEFASFKQISTKTLNESADVRNRGKDLFAQWDLETQSIRNPDIRAVAEQRRSALQKSYNDMLPPLITARADLTEVTSDLSDLQKALALDLTAPGIDASKRLFDQINRKADNTSKSLDAFAAELDKIAAALPASTVAPAK